MKESLHKELSSGKWFQLSLIEQLANIGSEVGRARKWHKKDEAIFQDTVNRSLELFDLTLRDIRWKGRFREIARARELFCGAVLGKNEYKTSFEDIEKYFFNFAVAVSLNK